MDQCHDLSAIQTTDAQPSVNLAQAVLIYAYEIRMAILEAMPRAEAPAPAPATDGELRILEDGIEAALRSAKFLSTDGRHAVRDLMATLRRARMSRAEGALWNSVFRKMARALGDPR